jgi:nucleotide-binding universal stress UspA family protein
MAGPIICGIDDSDSAKRAARVARGLSSELGLGLVFVRVVDNKSPEEGISAVTDRLARVADRLARVARNATEVDCGAGWRVDVGHPADRLVAVATAERASMVVVGSTGPRSPLLGSVSAEVSRRAPCPVVVVPPGADVTTPSGRRANDTSYDPESTDFAGGIVRFNLGSGTREA